MIPSRITDEVQTRTMRAKQLHWQIWMEVSEKVMAPRWLQDGSTFPQDDPKGSQDSTKMAQGGPRWAKIAQPAKGKTKTGVGHSFVCHFVL